MERGTVHVARYFRFVEAATCVAEEVTHGEVEFRGLLLLLGLQVRMSFVGCFHEVSH